MGFLSGLMVWFSGVRWNGRSDASCKRLSRLRAAFFEVDGRVFQRAVDYPDVELAFYDLSNSDRAVEEARETALSIQRTPMPLTGPLFKFALFKTRPDEFYLLACAHHIAIDGTGVALVGQRIASVYSAIVSGAPLPPVLFGSLQDLVDTELAYESSDEYRDDEAYWQQNLPTEPTGDYGLEDSGERDPWPSAPVAIDPAIVGRVEELARKWDVPRTSVITAACALLVRGWCAEGAEVVFDFPVNRRVSPDAKTLPGMVAGRGAAGDRRGSWGRGERVVCSCRYPDPGGSSPSAVPRARVGAQSARVGAAGSAGEFEFHPGRIHVAVWWGEGLRVVYQLWPGGRIWPDFLQRR